MSKFVTHRPLITAGTMIGIGMGGFVDGILFHQLLQVHNMLSAQFPVRGLDPARQVVNLETNMFWDGLFHVFTWIMTAAGIGMLWKAARDRSSPLSTAVFGGALLLGWGLFNFVEGVLNHHILHLHHVTEAPGHQVWDVLFLASGLALILTGWICIRSAPDKVHE